jgi:hypothetical protein
MKSFVILFCTYLVSTSPCHPTDPVMPLAQKLALKKQAQTNQGVPVQGVPVQGVPVTGAPASATK